MEPATRTIQLEPLAVRAAVSSVDEEARTAELIFSTGAPVQRFDRWTGDRYIETLSLDPKHVRLDRLDNGAPLLDTHSAYSVANQIGVVVEGSTRLSPKGAFATVRFSKRDSVAPLWSDVVGGIIRHVSVGYIVHRAEESINKIGAKLRHAIDWEPHEISMVPIAADPGAHVRHQTDTLNPCVLIRQHAVADADRIRRLQIVKAQAC